MKGIILAAGRGHRMGRLTANTPKCLLSIKNKTLLHYQIEAMQYANINEIGVVVGYQHEKIDDKKIHRKFLNPYWQTSNMVRSLLTAKEWLEQDTCIVSYGDIFYEGLALQLLTQSTAPIAITYDQNFKQLWTSRFTNPLNDLETFLLDENHYLLEIGRRAQSWTQIQGQYMGLLKFAPAGWEMVYIFLKTLDEKQMNQLDMTTLLNHLLQVPIKIKAIPFAGQWGEVDQPSDLALYESWSDNLLTSMTFS